MQKQMYLMILSLQRNAQSETTTLVLITWPFVVVVTADFSWRNHDTTTRFNGFASCWRYGYVALPYIYLAQVGLTIVGTSEDSAEMFAYIKKYIYSINNVKSGTKYPAMATTGDHDDHSCA
jgi:hypothetical protein